MTARFPEWLRRTWASGQEFDETKRLLEGLGLNTVCQNAHCPNQGECWKHRTATLMILGNRCTRGCAFCSVQSACPPEDVDALEPQRVAEAVATLGLEHVVITSVTRDDLPDGGATHFARTLDAIRAAVPETKLEVLVPDFQGCQDAVVTVLVARPDVFGHNIETVRRLYPRVRHPRAQYDVSLNVLRAAARYAPAVVVKSGLMVGHGETIEEIRETLVDLLDAGCRAVTMGQYLQPTPAQRPVTEFITPEQFREYERMAYEVGFLHAVAGPFVRSSYHAGGIWKALEPDGPQADDQAVFEDKEPTLCNMK